MCCWPVATGDAFPASGTRASGHRGIRFMSFGPQTRRSYVVGRGPTRDSGQRSTAMPSRHKDKAEEALPRAPWLSDALRTGCAELGSMVDSAVARGGVGKEGRREESCQNARTLTRYRLGTHSQSVADCSMSKSCRATQLTHSRPPPAAALHATPPQAAPPHLRTPHAPFRQVVDWT